MKEQKAKQLTCGDTELLPAVFQFFNTNISLYSKKFKIITITVIKHLLTIEGIGAYLNNKAQPMYSIAIVNNDNTDIILY